MEENKFFEKLADALRASGWQRTAQYGVLQNGKFYFVLYLNDQTPVVEFSSSDKCMPCLTGITIADQSWHLECHGFILTFGKIPRYVIKQGSDSKCIETISEQINKYTSVSEDTLYFCRATCKKVRKTEDVYTMNPIDSMKDGDIYCEMDGGKLYYVMKRPEGVHTLVRVTHPDNKKRVPDLFRAPTDENGNFVDDSLHVSVENINKAAAIGGAKLFERIAESQTVEELVWEQSEIDPNGMASLFSLTEQYDEFGLDAQHKRYLANALKRKFPAAALLNNSISMATIAGIYTLLSKNLPVSDLNTSFTEDAVDALVRLATDGISIKRYAVPGYTSARIQKLYSDFSLSFDQLKTKLVSEGFSQDQIAYIREVASAGGGISSAYNHNPVIVNRMKALASSGYMTGLLNFMAESATNGAITCSVPWTAIPQSLKDEFKDSFYTFPAFKSHGKTWTEIIDFCFSQVKAVIYRHPFGVMLHFDYFYLAIQDNYVAIRNSGFNNVWIVELVNNKVYVNDFDMPRGLWDEESD